MKTNYDIQLRIEWLIFAVMKQFSCKCKTKQMFFRMELFYVQLLFHTVYMLNI